MNTTVSMPAIFRHEVGDSIFEDLKRIYPRGCSDPREHVFEVLLPANDSRILLIQDRLRRAGFLPWTDITRTLNKKSEYIMNLEHHYDASDIAETKFLVVAPPENAGNPGAVLRSDDGRIIVPENRMPRRKWAFYIGSANSIFISAAVKEVLEQSDLVGLRFLPTRFQPRDWRKGDTDATVRSRHGDPYWELDSDRRMPPLAPSVTLIDMDSVPLPVGSEGPGFPREGLYINPQLHYRASDISKLESFDIARTYERYQAYDAPGDRPLIVSNRFYKFCVQHGLKGGWAPVQIDPD